MRGAQPLRALQRAVAQHVAPLPGEMLVAAVSGGSDSVALAGLLCEAAAGAGATVIVAHVNHQTRQSAWQDEAVALAVAAALDVRAVVRAAPAGSHAEARLRVERYRLLAAIARESGATRVFTAHHAGDQTESVLLALFRGTGRAGIGGIPARRQLDGGVRLERPLLRHAKDGLAAYAASRRLPYAVDPTNADPGYRRNAVRAALARLRPSFPHLDEAVARYVEIASPQNGSRARLRDRLRQQIAVTADVRDITFERLDAAAQAIENGNRGRIFLAPGVEIELTDGRVLLPGTSNEENPHPRSRRSGLEDATSGRE